MAATLTFGTLDEARAAHAAALAHCERAFLGGVQPAPTVQTWWTWQRPPVVDPDVGGAIARAIWHTVGAPAMRALWDGAGGDR